MKVLLPSAIIGLSLVLFGLQGCAPERSDNASSHKLVDAQPFDADAAWEEFETQFRLFYAYIEREDFDVEKLMTRTEAMAQSQLSAAGFQDVLRRMSYAFTDPHLVVGPLSDTDYNVIPTSSDLVIRFEETRYRVMDVRQNSPAFKAGIRPGWELIAVNNASLETAIKANYTGLIDTLTDKQRGYMATIIANGKRKGKRHLTFHTKKETRNVTLESPREFAIQLSKTPILSTSRGPQGKIGIIRINNSLGHNDLITAFDEALENLSDTKALIIDLRNTPSGGNTEVGRSIIGHFITEPRPYQVHEIPSLEREFTVPRHFVEYAKPRAPYYDPAKTVVLGGPWTGSMGEGIVIGLDAAADMHTIASDMGDLLGGLSNFTLQKSGTKLDIGTETLFHVNGTPREDFEADLRLSSADTHENGHDPVMTWGLAHLTNLILDD